MPTPTSHLEMEFRIPEYMWSRVERLIERAVRAALLAHQDDLAEREERERQEEVDEWVHQMELRLNTIANTSED